MRFFLDHNVDALLAVCLVQRRHEALILSNYLEPNSPDHLVATMALHHQCVLVSHDKDMRSIEKKASQGWRDRYPLLCRVMLCCPEPMMVNRFMEFLPLIELEHHEAAERSVPLMFEVGERRIRIHR